MSRIAFGRMAVALCGWILALVGRAEEFYLPPDAGVIDVTQSPYFAKGDGKSDDTEALQQALLDHPNENRIIYLPNGTYLISATLRWPSSARLDSRWRATIIQGQSREGTILRLADYSPGFSGTGKGRAMIWTGEKGHVRARNAVRNLTLHTGQGNPGATGIQFTANKQGCIRDVTILSGSPKFEGLAGIDLTHTDENGPFFVSNVRIRGFDYGVRTAYPVYGATFEHLELSEQRECGIRNSSQSICVRDLRSTNRVVAIENTDVTGFVVLLDSVLQGTATNRVPPALRTKGFLFARNVVTPGYTPAIDNRGGHDQDASGPEIREFVSHQIFNLFAAPQYSLNLPIVETPTITNDPPDQWVSPLGFGGTANDGKDDSVAVQAAIDSGKTTLYLPNGTWTLKQPVELRGNIRRVIGCEARLSIEDLKGIPALVLTNGTAKRVSIERLEVDPGFGWFLKRVAERDLILKDCFNVRATFEAKGDLFIEDVASSGSWKFKDMTVYARQFTVEPEATKIYAEGGLFWGMGLKADWAGTLVQCVNSNRCEVLGGLCVANGSWKEAPLFKVEDSVASFVMAEASFTRAPFQTIVSERRGNITRNLSNQGLPDSPMPFRIGGVGIPLFVAYQGLTGNVEPRLSLGATRTNAPARPGPRR